MDVPWAVVTSLSVLLATPIARAQQESVAESLFRQAREEMKHGEAQNACPKFEESYRLDPSIGTLLNLALCEEAIGHTATAWTKLRQFIDSAPAGDSRLRLAKNKIEKLEAQLPWLRLVVDESDDQMIVQLDGIELRDASLSEVLPVNPGAHVVRVARVTGETNETSFQIQPAEKLTLHVTLPPREPSSEPAVPVTAPAIAPSPVQPARSPAVKAPELKTASSNRSTEYAVAYGLAGVGVVGVITGTVFGVMAIQNRNTVRDHCPNHQCDDQTGLDAAESGARNTTISSTAFVVGALGLASGGVLLWHLGNSKASVSVTPNSACLYVQAAIQ